MTRLQVVDGQTQRDVGPNACIECRFLLSRGDAPAYWRCGAQGGLFTSLVNPSGACTSWRLLPPGIPSVVAPDPVVSRMWIFFATLMGALIGWSLGLLVMR